MGIKIDNFLGITARDIAQTNNIPHITVEEVIKSYLDSLITSAKNGERVVIDGLTSITVVKGVYTHNETIKKNLPKRVREIAYKLGINLNTVELVIKEYLQSLINKAKSGQSVIINGLANITVTTDGDGYLSVRCGVAPSLKSMLENISSGEYYLRGRLSPALKTELSKIELVTV